MNICFITERYPGKHSGTDFAFVKQLVDAIAEMGHQCLVLSPFNISHYRCLSRNKEIYVKGKGNVTVYRPGYLSFSSFYIGKFQPTSWFHKRAMKRAFRMMAVKPDVIYGHFWGACYDGFEYAKSNNIPLFVATGESNIREMFPIPPNIKEFRDYVSGVICVSSKNRDDSINLGLTTTEKCVVLPNSINADLFYKRDKNECRKQLGFPIDAFIVSFVGWFNERKGALRVSEAIKLIGGVKSIFIGKGDQDPSCDDILFKGALPHEQVPLYLCSSDCFVLPTLQEGCCNAVIEAMACGLPIISSNRPFNWDVLNEGNSIMIDPTNIKMISEAISNLIKDEQKREALSLGALETAKKLTIERRAKLIVEFIKSKL